MKLARLLSGEVSEDSYTVPNAWTLAKRRLELLGLAVACAILTLACAPSRSPDLAADEKAIRELSTRWQKALLDRDAATQASMFAADGVSYHDGQEPLVGPAAILAWEQKAVSNHPKAKITTTTDRIQISTSGDLAIQTGEGRLTSLGANGEDAAVHRQRFLTIWKKVDGQWKVAHDMAVNITPWQ